MRAGRITVAIIGGLVSLLGFCLLVAGVGLLVVNAVARDADGFYTARAVEIQTAAPALVSEVDLGDNDMYGSPAHPLGTVRIRATAADNGPLFIGVGPTDQVQAWLNGTTYTKVTGLRLRPLRAATEPVVGSAALTPPGNQAALWTASVSGPGTQTLIWDSSPGKWTFVVATQDAHPGFFANVALATKISGVVPIAWGLTGAGLGLLAIGIIILLLAVRGTAQSNQQLTQLAGSPGSYPVRLDAALAPDLSRWLWLVKWLLAIPHLFILALLWMAMLVLTVVAFFAILFTGRYPRSIFEFNVGVMRWGWRVSYYAFSAMGTDKYPPFSLYPDPNYPADFTVEYPQHLSRGLVLVKWWLLAIPQYVVISLFSGGGPIWGFGWSSVWFLPAGFGLIGILVLVAVVVLLFTGRYRQEIFDFVLGLNRWCYRVYAYAGLMRDEYPPFRLDQGGTDPGTARR